MSRMLVATCTRVELVGQGTNSTDLLRRPSPTDSPEMCVDWKRVLIFPANLRFKMAELMAADSTEISSQNEENSVVQDEDQRARLTHFPQTRIRNMMKIDPDLHLANRESVFLLTRAAVSQVFIRFNCRSNSLISLYFHSLTEFKLHFFLRHEHKRC